MSKENVELIREAWDAWMEGEPTDLGDMSLIDAEVVFGDEILPDRVGETYYGHVGLQKAWALTIEPWESFEVELEWARDAGDQVVSCHRVRGPAKGSGIDLEARYAYVWRIRGDKVVHLRSYGDPAEALEAAGLRDG
jgi:ketosteroid isomerase-like protein